MKIAPTLQGMFPTLRVMNEKKDRPTIDRAQKELRALLAVARAAAKVIDAERDGGSRILDDDTHHPADVALSRALSRLDRVSKGEP